jgi:hypothetical protein
MDVSLKVEHSYVGDLEIVLEHPATGTNLVLARTGYCGNTDIEATFDDEATVSYTDVCDEQPAIHGRVRPAEQLDRLDGLPLDGTWQLSIADLAPSDDGTFISWCMKPVVTDLCAFVGQIPAEECRALTDLYARANGPTWWNSEDWMTTRRPCGWNGVTCEAGHVAGINLVNNRLKGSLPPSLGALTELRQLLVSNNPQLGGMLPPALVGQPLDMLWYDRTGICTPNGRLMAEWLEAIPDLRRTDTGCSQGWLPLVGR